LLATFPAAAASASFLRCARDAVISSRTSLPSWQAN
jgi:hypothetical protein